MHHHIKVSCTTDNLKVIRDFTEKSLRGSGMSDEEIHLMVLAVDEICANVIIHSNDKNQDKTLEITITRSKEGFIFEILDSGLPFDHNSLPETDLKTLVKEKRKGGLGLLLVKRIMDSIELKTESSVTVYRLFKKASTC